MATKDSLYLGFKDTKHLILLGLGGTSGPVSTVPPFMFKNNTGIYISKAADGSQTTANTVKVNVKDFSFNQVSNMDIISRDTVDATQERINNAYVQEVFPVSFSFVTYIEPILDTNVTSPEEFLWVSLMGADTVSNTPSSSVIDFSDGNVKELQNLTLWFHRSGHNKGNYRLNNAVIDSATINFDINNLAEIQWQGRALAMVPDETPPILFTDRTDAEPCIKTKLTTISVGLNTTNYNLALVGGSINISNNNIFYGRPKLGQTTIPEGHYTGNRAVRGSFNFYLKDNSQSSADLYNTVLAAAKTSNYESIFKANATVTVGGSLNSNIVVNIPELLFEVGRQNFNDVISINMPFVAQESTGNYMSVQYNN